MTAPAPKPRLERDAVLAALRPRDVIARYQIEGRERGDEFRTRICPACGPRTRADAVAINLATGRWSDHAHGCAGDLLALVAGLNNLDVKRDFEQVLAIAADIAGVGPESDPAAVERHRQRMRDDEHRRKLERERRTADGKRRAAAIWQECARACPWAGEKYLREQRGLDVEQLVRRDLVRFGQGHGDPYVALYSSLGQVVNVVARRIDVGRICPACHVLTRGADRCWRCSGSLDGAEPGPKTPGAKDAPTAGTLVGHLQQLRPGGTAVVVEGVIDSLTAALAWPDAVILGAHGVGNYPLVAGYAARHVRDRAAHLFLVAHNDPPRRDPATGDTRPGIGQAAADEAMRLAIEEGLVTTDGGGEPVCRVRAVDIGGHKDLNDAWRAGWRP